MDEKHYRMFLFFIMFLMSVGGGLYCIIASTFNWDFFFNNDKGRFFTNIFGRTGARVFYFILGLMLLMLFVKFFSLISK